MNSFKSAFASSAKSISRVTRAIFGKKSITSVVALATTVLGMQVLGAQPAQAVAALPAFTCSPSPYFTDNSSNWLKYDVLSNKFVWADATNHTFTLSSLNGIGYSPDDNHVYGFGSSGFYQVGSNGTSVVWGSGTPAGTSQVAIPTNQAAGDYWPSGHLFLSSSASGSGSTLTWNAITIGASNVTSSQNFTISVKSGSTAMSVKDFTISDDGTQGWAYGLAGTTLFRVNLNTKVQDSVTVQSLNSGGWATPDSGDYGAAYADSSGNAYFFNNSSKKVFQIPFAELQAASPRAKVMGSGSAATSDATGSWGSTPDGASCSKAASPFAPAVATTAATSVTATGATLNGTISPNLTALTDAYFCFGVDAATVTACTNKVSLSAATLTSLNASLTTANQAVSIAVPVTLNGATTYYYALTATNSVGSATSTNGTFTTSAVAPVIATASISGSAVVGQTLTASASGVAGAPSPTATYQWFAGGVAISGATASTYLLTSAENGAIITVRITETNSAGNASATSTGTSAVTAANQAPAIATATISGTPTVGQVLTAGSTGVTGVPTPTLTYQWYAGGVGITGATSSTFTLTSTQVGAAITVTIWASNGVGSAASATSSPTSNVAAASAAPAISSASVSGTPTVGQTLTCAASGVTGNPTPTVTYQWYAGASAISGATSSTFVLTGTQVGSSITCVATATNASGNASATSGGTANVVPANAAPTIATATITGTATQGQTLTAGYTGLTGYPTPTVTYQWYSNGVAISGATGSTFVLGVAQVGTVMTVRATATNSSGNASATSTGTSSVIYANAAPAIATATASGSMLVGTTLSAVATGVTGYPAPTATYQWFADGSAISGATASTFTITVSQLGAVITVTITETNSSGTASATSVGGSAVTYPNAAPAIASASITGTTTVGQTLTAGSTGVTGWPVPTLSYQWFANGSPISGATGSTFVLTSGQIGAVITVRVTASNGIGSAASATSPGTSSVIPANSAPVIASAAVTGTTTVGQALTCTPSGVAGYPAPTVTYQWYAGGVAISGATSATFTLTSTQVGLAITCVATATNSSGAATATSNATSNVVPANAAPTIATATITGTATQGQTLTAGYTGLTGYPTPTVTYQWYANGVAISGATNSSFVLGVAQVGAVITVRATATNSSGSASAVSSATATVGYANAAPTIATATASGALLVGSTLTAGATGVTGYPAPTATYQWYANGVAISGATASTYVLTSAEVGAVITVEVTETNAFGTASAISNGGAAVNYPNLAPGIATATITGTPTVGQTLTSGYTGVTGFPTPTLSYQWLANGVVISGATGTTFVVTSAQVGMAITVRIAASNGVGSAAFATSSPTSTVSPANAAPAIGGATITGTPTVGQTLTCTPTGVTGYPAPTLTYQWYAGGVAISGATAATFLLTGGQVGAAITCVVTATNGVGSAATATSGATSNVAAAPVAASSYAIVASAGSNGTITPAGVTNVAAGANQTYRITPALGYQIDTILVDGVIVANANTYAFVTVVDTHTIKVTFISIVLANAPVPVELGPGSSIATHNGQAVPVTVTPNSTNNGVIITGDGWSLTLQGIDAAGNPIPLTADGKLILTPGQFAAIVGTGFSPNTPAIVWIFSSPVQLGQFTVDASGNFSGVMPIPTTISVGNHTAVVQGVGTAGENRQANLGVIVGALPVVSTVTFAGDSAALNAQALAALKAIATTVKKSAPASTPVTITVKGWVAPTASTANDAALSLARANAAKTALQKLGVKATFVVSGQGVWDVGTGPAKKAQITVTFGKKN